LRKYGHGPFRVAVIHGGPGAPGEMAPVARELSRDTGVLEPLQTADSVEGQVEELRGVLEKDGDIQLILIGFSWGAWLSYIVTARYPLLVRKLILVSSGPFEEKYAGNIIKTRLSRLSTEEKKEVLYLMTSLDSAKSTDNNTMARFGQLMSKADSYEPLPRDGERFNFNPDIYHRVWKEASELRRSGELLQLGERIQCPLIAIHGDFDSHPAEGIREPLSRVLKDFRFILLEKCGHYPWLERQARDRFYDILREEVRLLK